MTYKAQYHKPNLEYNVKKELDKLDFTNRIDKTMHLHNLEDGFYGFTWLGENYMGISDKLVSGMDYDAATQSIVSQKGAKTQSHEAGHWPDEYDTRIWTDWIHDITLAAIKYLKNKYNYINKILENNQHEPNYRFAH